MGTTSQKLQYLTTTKSNIKDAINLTGANILSEDTFRSYADKLKQGLVDAINDGGSTIYSNFPKTTGEGTEITLNDTYEAPMEIGLNGNTHQDSYTGKNLFNFTGETHGDNVTVTQNDNELQLTWTGGYAVNLKNIVSNLDSSKTYTVSFKHKGESLDLRNGSVTVQTIRTGANTDYTLCSATITNITSFEFKFVRSSGTTSTAYIKDFQIEEGLTATNFEKFVGGSPSPSPDFPQPIEVVTGDNTINIRGKNLFDISKVERNVYYNYGTQGSVPTVASSDKRITLSPPNSIKVKPNTQYTLSFPSGFRYALAEMENNYISLGDSGWKTNATYTFTTGATTNYIGFNFSKTDNFTITDNDWNTFINSEIQFEQGSTNTEYQPYQSSNYSINLGSIELCKIGTYQDYIYKENNKWYKHSEIGKVVLDGTEQNLVYDSTHNRLQMSFNLQTQDWSALALTLCDHFIMGDTETVNGSFNITRTTLYFKNIALTSLNDWKTWLENNNTLIYYVLATPTDTEITDTDLIEQLETIRTAKSVENKTIISQTNANLPFIISASALSKN